MRIRSGFTIIEILTCICVVMVLAALIFPIMQRAVLAGKRADRISQFSQLAKALELYRSDYSEGFPLRGGIPGQTWVKSLEPYIGDVRLAVIDEYVKPSDGIVFDQGDGLAMNGCLMRPGVAVELNSISFFASATFQKKHVRGQYINTMSNYCPDSAYAKIHPDEEAIGGKFLSEHFFGGAVYARLDGSAKWISAAEFSEGDQCSCGTKDVSKAFFQTVSD